VALFHENLLIIINVGAFMKQKNTLITIMVLIVVLLIAINFMVFSPNGATIVDEEIRIGVVLPLSGGAASYGEGWKKGVELAIDKLEEEYGTNKIKVIYEDSQLSATKTATVTQKLINLDKVDAIIIGSSSETLAAAPIAEANKVLLMAAGSSAAITDAGDFVFRTYPSDSYQGNDLADLISKKGHKRVAILNVQNDYGEGLVKIFKNKFNENKGTVAVSEKFGVEAPDYKAQLTKIKAESLDAILIVGHNNHYISILKQMKELNVNLPIFASETFQEQSILDEAGELAEGVVFTTFTEPSTNDLKIFMAKHESKYGAGAFPFATFFYDNTMLTAKALINNKGDVVKAQQWLYNLKGFRGVTGTTSFDENGDVFGKSYTVMKVKNGKFVLN
jgi:branched-chain amino acid transport system substrate-binding protein